MAVDVEVLYRDHLAPIWRYVRARLPSDADAEDVTSDVFAQAVRSRPRFDPEQGSERAWLAGIARHLVAEWWRQQRRAATAEQAARAIAAAAEPEADPEEAALRSQAVDELRRYLGVLTPREREAVALRFAAELSSQEVGEALGTSAEAARMLVHRAVSKLREAMESEVILDA